MFDQMRLTRTFLSLIMATSLVSCAGSNSALNPDVSDNFEVNGSFLKSSSVAQEKLQQPESKNKQALAFSEEVISSMNQISHGSPLLTQVPQFGIDEPIKVALNEMELPQLVHYVFGDVLALSYVMSSDVERMRDKVALKIKDQVTPSELYGITRQILAQQKVEVYTKDNIVYLDKASKRVVNRAVGIGNSISDMPSTGDDIVQLVPYTYNSSRAVINILKKLSNAKAYPDTANRLLVIEGTRSDVERALQVVAMLDVPHARGRDIRLLNLVYLTPTELIEEITELMKAEGLMVGDDISLVALNRLNSVVVYSGSEVLGRRVSMWAKKIDVATGGEKPRFYVYRPQYAKAVDLIKSLDVLVPKKTNQTTTNTDSSKAAAAVPPSQQTGTLSVTADEVQNAIVIHATPDKYFEVMGLLQQLDRLPGQVALQVVVVEVDLTDKTQRGIDWNYNESGIEGGDLQTGALTSSTGSFAYNLVRGDWKVALNLLQSQTNSKILSRPYLVVKDGESASINSGEQIPIVTETTSSDSSPDVSRTSVQYRSTGVTLSVTPTINAKGLVSLEVSQETSNSPENSTSLTPPITSRSVQTTVFAASGQTVALGGLIKESTVITDSKVPVLGDIPWVGNLFQTKGKNKVRTELIILITPRVILDTVDLDDFSNRLNELYSFPINQ